MNSPKVLINRLCLATSVLAALFFCGGWIAVNEALGADPPLRPTAWTDVSGKTIHPNGAMDTDLTSCAEITTGVDAFPSVTYHSWASTVDRYSSLTLYIDRSSVGHLDDTWGIKYSVNAGQTWSSLDGMSSRNVGRGVLLMPLDASQNLKTLQVRIDSDRTRAADGGRVYIYDIRVEGTPAAAARLEQSSYRFFRNVDSADLTAIVSSVEGADEATAITLMNGSMYIAGFEPGKWRIEKRSCDNGHLEALKTSEAWGTPRGMATEGSALYIIGDEYSEGNYRWRVEKRDLADLTLMEGFGTNGAVTSDPSAENDSAYGIAVDSDFMYVIGSDRAHGVSDAQWRVEKRSLADGTLVDFVCHNPSMEDDIPLGIAIDANFVYVVGYDRIPGVSRNPGKNKNESNAEWRIEKRSRLTLDLAAAATSNPTENFDTAKGVAVDSSFMYVIGSQESAFSDMEWRLEKRSLQDLSFDSHFMNGGIVTSDVGYDDQPESIVIDENSMYVAGYSAEIGSGGTTAWRIEKRYLDSGALVYSVTNDLIADHNDRARAIVMDSEYMYVTGYENSGLSNWRTEKRFLSDGGFAFLEPLADPNTAAQLQGNSEFRLRLLIHTTSGTLLVGDESFRLQISECDSGLWYDVTDCPWVAFRDNPTPGDGDVLAGNALDPDLGSLPIKRQTYVESNRFTNSVSPLEAGEVGMWDVSFSIPQGAPSGHYCLGIVKGEGTELEATPFAQFMIDGP